MDWAEQAGSFDREVERYERARPSYPLAAVRWLVPAAGRPGLPPQVIDLAAGTGKLTRGLLRAGCRVTAVEPLDGMRAELARRVPGVPALAGRAEDIPLPAGSADAVVVGQAWHWFDGPAAAAEIARVLRPGGSVGLVWNQQDDTVRWVADMRDLLGERNPTGQPGQQPTGSDSWRPSFGPAFGEPAQAVFRNVQHLDLATLLDNIASRSYVISLPDGQRGALLAAVAELVRSHPDTTGLSRYELPYQTRCWRAFRL